MSESTHLPASDPWAHRAAARAARRGGYMAGLLAAYQEIEGMNDQQLAETLGCPPANLPLLGLCREPRRQSPRFAADIQAIAAYCGANAGRLAHLVRVVDTTRTLASHAGERTEGFLAAARDADASAVEPVTSAGEGEPETGPAAPRDEAAPTPEHEGTGEGEPDGHLA